MGAGSSSMNDGATAMLPDAASSAISRPCVFLHRRMATRTKLLIAGTFLLRLQQPLLKNQRPPYRG
jgi:hypothetical protein